jgi:chemotaxis receptor (MCP) glutamine deamidase CheD
MSNANTVPVTGASGRVSDSEEVEFSVEDLGFGVCVVVHDPQVRASGVAHVIAPSSSVNTTYAGKYPYAFSDTAVPALLEALRKLSRNYAGAAWNDALKRLKVTLVGASEIGVTTLSSNVTPSNDLNQGKLTAAKLRDSLRGAGLTVSNEVLGGNGIRNVVVKNYTGRIIVSEPGRPQKEL